MSLVLVIDDDALVRSAVCRTLAARGKEVIEAADGRIGLELAQQRRPATVVCDILMPEIEGLETIGRIRADLPATRIVAISGGGLIAGWDYLTMAQRLGADVVLSKPFSKADLLDAVDGPPAAETIRREA